MSVKFTIRDQEFLRLVGKASLMGINAVAQTVANYAGERVNVSAQRGRVPSQAGEAPHVRTSQGKRSIRMESNEDEANPAARVGVTQNAAYMIWLEVGTGPRTITAAGGFLKIPWMKEVIQSPFELRRADNIHPKNILANLDSNKHKNAKGPYFYGRGRGGALIKLAKLEPDGLGNRFFFFARSIRYPGTRPRPWLVPSLVDNRSELASILIMTARGHQ